MVNWCYFFHNIWYNLPGKPYKLGVFFVRMIFATNSTPLWRRQWHPTPVLLPGKSHGRRNLVGCSPWSRWELDTTQWLHFHFHALEKEMATYSSVLAWRIPGMAEPGGLPSMGSHRVGHYWSDLAAAAAAVPLITEQRIWTCPPMYKAITEDFWSRKDIILMKISFDRKNMD